MTTLVLLAHHAHAYLEIEIMGREFPDGPTEHWIAAGVAVVVVGLMGYGAFAGVRDVWAMVSRRKGGAKAE